jgi:very-short-patch-repair endonuclease
MNQENRSERIRGVSAAVQQAATILRDEMTPAEALLWEELRAKRLNGLRFRAQHPVGQFILDFYCPACKLAVEVDGTVHEGEEEQDAARTAQLEAHACRVLRFTNEAVMMDLSSVLARIEAMAREKE